jgi:hypothetical protein
MQTFYDLVQFYRLYLYTFLIPLMEYSLQNGQVQLCSVELDGATLARAGHVDYPDKLTQFLVS